jgi:hypothetical protein
MLGKAVVVVKDVPADVCRNCGEPVMPGAVTDRLLELLERFAHLPVEVSVTSYSELLAAWKTLEPTAIERPRSHSEL